MASQQVFNHSILTEGTPPDIVRIGTINLFGRLRTCWPTQANSCGRRKRVPTRWEHSITYNLEITRAIIAAAEAKRAPIILQTGASALRYASFSTLSALVLADRGLDLGPVWAGGQQVSRTVIVLSRPSKATAAASKSGAPSSPRTLLEKP